MHLLALVMRGPLAILLKPVLEERLVQKRTVSCSQMMGLVGERPRSSVEEGRRKTCAKAGKFVGYAGCL